MQQIRILQRPKSSLSKSEKPTQKRITFLEKDEKDVEFVPANTISKRSFTDTSEYLLHQHCINEDEKELARLLVYADINKPIKSSIVIDDSDFNPDYFKESDTPLHIAIRRGNLNIVKILLAQPDINVNQENNFKMTPLELAFSLNQQDIFNELLKSSFPDINSNLVENFTFLKWIDNTNAIAFKMNADYILALCSAMDDEKFDNLFLLLKNRENNVTKFNNVILSETFIKSLQNALAKDANIDNLEMLATVNTIAYLNGVICEETYNLHVEILKNKTNPTLTLLEMTPSFTEEQSIHDVFEQNDEENAFDYFELLRCMREANQLSQETLCQKFSEKSADSSTPVHTLMRMGNVSLFKIYINYIVSLLEEAQQKTLLTTILWSKNAQGQGVADVKTDSTDSKEIKTYLSELRRKYN
jgi:hypothetical protein